MDKRKQGSPRWREDPTFRVLDERGRAELLVDRALDPESEHANPLLVAIDQDLAAATEPQPSAARPAGAPKP